MWSACQPNKHCVAVHWRVISTGLPTAERNFDVVRTLVNILYKVTHGLYYASNLSNPGRSTKRTDKSVLRKYQLYTG